MTQAVRNTLIVLALAAVVDLLPGGNSGANFIANLLQIAFVTLFVALAYRFYRERNTELFSLGDEHRGALYGSLAALVFAFAAKRVLFESAGGTVLWIALVGGAVYALVAVFRHYRSYQY